MSHRFFVSPDQIGADDVAFTSTQRHQLHDVLRLRSGDTVRVFDGLTRLDHIVRLQDASHGVVVGTCAQAAEPRTRVVVYPSLLQRDKFESVLQKLTELGVAAIVPVLSARALVREAPDQKRMERWRSIVREATEQCGRGVVPELVAAQTFDLALSRAEGLRVVAYEAEREHDLKSALHTQPESVSLFVGPEGGYAPSEIERARGAGVQVVSLGPRILRTETASPVLAALVLYELGDLSSNR